MVKTCLVIDLNATPTDDSDTPAENQNVSDDTTVAELSKLRLENKMLREMLCDSILKNHDKGSMQDRDVVACNRNKRKLKEHDECNTGESTKCHQLGSSSIARVDTHTYPSHETMVVKDGYRWRMYGQKLTKDNPWPRSYYKCYSAPSCPAKKKVQKSAQDAHILVTTYEGDHNHEKIRENEDRHTQTWTYAKWT